MKKKVLIGLIIIVLVILLFPRRNTLNNGGTIEYKAVVYKVSKVHRYKIDGKYNNNFRCISFIFSTIALCGVFKK